MRMMVAIFDIPRIVPQQRICDNIAEYQRTPSLLSPSPPSETRQYFSPSVLTCPSSRIYAFVYLTVRLFVFLSVDPSDGPSVCQEKDDLGQSRA